MLKYIIKRVLQFIPVFFGVTLILFLIANYMPGSDPVQMKVGEKKVTPELRKQIETEYGLNRPWYVQYGDYLYKLTKGDLGISISTGRPVSEILSEKYPFTIKLALVAIIFEIIFYSYCRQFFCCTIKVSLTKRIIDNSFWC